MPKYDVNFILRTPATVTVTAKNMAEAKQKIKDLPNGLLKEKIALSVDYIGVKVVSASKVE